MDEPESLLGQLERSPDGQLWAVLYCGENVVRRERVESARKGRKKLTELLLAAAEPNPAGLDRRPSGRHSSSRRIEIPRQKGRDPTDEARDSGADQPPAP